MNAIPPSTERRSCEPPPCSVVRLDSTVTPPPPDSDAASAPEAKPGGRLSEGRSGEDGVDPRNAADVAHNAADAGPGSSANPPQPWWRAVGPALVVAAVVLGPGSILTASKVGCGFGADLLWVVGLAALLMMGVTATAATLGCRLPHTLGTELTHRLGRPAAIAVGGVLFLLVLSFQGSNNMAVLAGVEAMLGRSLSPMLACGVLLALNGLLIAVLWRSRRLYRPIEVLMKVIVGAMVVGFLVNFLAARPDLVALLGGLVPRWPADLPEGWLPVRQGEQVVDPLRPVTALVATTFSVAAAYYQAYLVREKNWTAADLRTGLLDSLLGIAALGLATSLVMLTAATVLHGDVPPESLTDLAAVASQLAPAFGPASEWLFAFGVLGGAFSSFLGNAIVGGTLLADGLGQPSRLDDRACRWATTAALLGGALPAAILSSGATDRIGAIVWLQSVTVLGLPLLAATLLYLAIASEARVQKWAIAATAVGTLVAVVLALRTAYALTL